MSGHIFFKERWYGFDDGLYTAARLLEILSRDPRPTQEIFAILPNTVNTPELNLKFAEGEHFTVHQGTGQARPFPGRQAHHHRRPARGFLRRLRPGARLQHHAGAGVPLRGGQPGGTGTHPEPFPGTHPFRPARHRAALLVEPPSAVFYLWAADPQVQFLIRQSRGARTSKFRYFISANRFSKAARQLDERPGSRAARSYSARVPPTWRR